MATRMVVCPECGEAVPFGRLACSNCGALLASVAGSAPAAPTIVDGPDEPPELEPEPEPALPYRPEPPDTHEAPDEVPAASDAASAHAELAEPDPEPAEPDPEPAEPDPERAAPEPLPARPLPGAWVPPAANIDDPDSADDPRDADMTGLPAHGSLPSASPAPAQPEAGPAGRRADLGISLGRVEEVAGWFVFLGGAIAAAGFVLPWSSVVIGAEGFGSYLDTWGLASPSHVLVFVSALIVAGLGYLRPRLIRPWVRTGILGIVLGSLLIGLVWPYLLGPLGASIGVVVVGIAAVMLVVGGVAAVWAARHDDGKSPV